MNTISNAKLKTLIENLYVSDVLSMINIEDIEDHTVKVVCRTILGSIETLNDLLAEPLQVEASNI